MEQMLTPCATVDVPQILKDCALDCVWDMLPIPNPCGKFGQWLSAGIGAIGGLFDSFPADTPVHVKPAGATAAQAQGGYATTKPIGELKVGDEVLSVAEWLDAGSEPKRDARLQYNRITEVRESHRPQTLVHLTLDTGETIRATAGHAFKTTEGWRDAILLKRGGKLLLKGGGEASESDGSATAPAATAAITDAKTERVATVTEVRTEQTTVRVFNLEVANAHTFFVGMRGRGRTMATAGRRVTMDTTSSRRNFASGLMTKRAISILTPPKICAMSLVTITKTYCTKETDVAETGIGNGASSRGKTRTRMRSR
jgi:hypothetical protein